MTIKESVLAELQNNKEIFISGEHLSSAMGVSRTAVWKAINSLREDGHLIEAVTNKGYMLLQDSWNITETNLRSLLPAKYKDLPLHVLDSIGSTNDHAKQLALNGAAHGTVVIAKQQSGGKGRLGRSFFSPREGIYLSIIIKPEFDLSKSVLITAAAAVAVCEAIEKISGHDVGIKWVNDIYIGGKKVCGILTEGIPDFETGRIDTIIIGIGINTTTQGFPKELLDIAGCVNGNYSRSALTAEVICKTLDLVDDIECKSFIETYKKKSVVIGKTVTVYKGIYKTDPGEMPSKPARVLDIDENGGLIVLYTDGTRETLNSGEISIRL